MSNMTDIITYLSDNIEAILVTLFTVHAAAVAVANLTPTPKDDAFLARAYGWIEVAAGIVTKKAKK